MIDTKALREKILDLAIRGKLVPQDPNDEPASVLLERIRAQKQQMVKEGKLKAKDIKNDTIIFKGEDNLHYEQFQDGTVKCIEDEIPFDVPDGWAWARISSISEEIFAGGDKPENFSKEQNEECPYAIYSNAVENDGLYGFTDIPRVVKPSITVSGRGTIGFSCIRCIPFFPIVRLITITPSSLILLEFLDFVFKRLLETGAGSSIPQLTVPMVKPKLIPIPPLKEQKKIVVTATNFFEQIKIIDKIAVDLLDTISIVKPKILDLAIRGKLVPQDPNDEPASVLLERIRAEKEELIKQGKIKRDKKESVIFKGEDNSYYEKIGNQVTCIDDELPFKIPNNWCWARLSSIAINYDSYRKPINSTERKKRVADKEKDKLYPYFGATGQVGVIDDYLFDGEYILLGEDAAPFLDKTTQKAYIVSGKVWVNNHAHILESLILSEYLLHSLNSIDYLNYVYGTTRLKLTQENMNKILLPIPPIKEQIKLCQVISKANSFIKSIEASLN